MHLHTKPLGELTYRSAGRDTLDIPRDGVVSALNLRVQFTITNGSSAAVGPLWQALARILQRVELTINGRDTIVSMDGPGLVARAIYEQGNTPYGVGDTVVLTGSAATVYEIIIPIPFYLPRSANAYLCALPASRLGQVVLAITWAASTCAQIYTTPNSAAISAVTCKVEGEYLVGAPEGANYLARILDMDTDEIGSDTNNFQTTIDTGTGLLYRSFLIAATDADIAEDDIVDELRLESGTQVFQKREAPFIQAGNKHKYNQSAHQTGVYFLHTELMGQGSMWINTAREVLHSDLKLVADVDVGTGTTNFINYRESIRPFKL